MKEHTHVLTIYILIELVKVLESLTIKYRLNVAETINALRNFYQINAAINNF